MPPLLLPSKDESFSESSFGIIMLGYESLSKKDFIELLPVQKSRGYEVFSECFKRIPEELIVSALEAVCTAASSYAFPHLRLSKYKGILI